MLLRRTFLIGLASILFSTQGCTSDNSELDLMEGVEYKRIAEPQTIAPHSKKVVAVFGYTCPHCYNLEPSLHKWLENKPKNVHYEAMPAVFDNPNWQIMARVFYTAKTLGVLDKSHSEFFHALHRDNVPFTGIEDIAKYFTKFGVTEKQFLNTYKGFKVDQEVRRAQKLTQAYGIHGVPAVIVNGKYLTDVPMAGSRENLWKVVNELSTK